jgi:hypothetical protein
LKQLASGGDSVFHCQSQIMSQPSSNDSAKAAVKIFVVDDEPMLLDLAAAILQPHGFKVWTFRDPQLALEEFPRDGLRHGQHDGHGPGRPMPSAEFKIKNHPVERHGG